MHFYCKNGLLKMRSEGMIDAPNLEHFEIQPTQTELNNLKNNVPAKIVNGSLLFDITSKPIPIDIKTIVQNAKSFDDLKSVLLKIVS